MAMIQELAEHGIRVWLEGSELKFKPKSKLSPSLIAKIKAHKREIARELREAQATKANTSYCSWLKTEVGECGPVCCEERPGRGVTFSCPHFKQYMKSIGRW